MLLFMTVACCLCRESERDTPHLREREQAGRSDPAQTPDGYMATAV